MTRSTRPTNRDRGCNDTRQDGTPPTVSQSRSGRGWMSQPGRRACAADEFPEGASEFTDEVSRRRFLSVMGASLALAGAAGATLRPASSRKIVPYTRQPDEITPGVPLFFATARRSAATGPASSSAATRAGPSRSRGTRPPVEPGRRRRPLPGLDPRPLRPGPLAARSPTAVRHQLRAGGSRLFGGNSTMRTGSRRRRPNSAS